MNQELTIALQRKAESLIRTSRNAGLNDQQRTAIVELALRATYNKGFSAGVKSVQLTEGCK